MGDGAALADAVTRMRRVRAIPLAFVATFIVAVATGGCFFTDPVNRAPIARITMETTAPFFPGSPVRFSAVNSVDPDADHLQYDWSACRNSCPGMLVSSGTAEDFEFVIPPSHEPIQVSLTIRDRHDARSVATVTISVDNRAPDLDMNIEGRQNSSGGYVVGHPMLLIADASDPDQDTLTYTFSYEGPLGVPVSPEWTSIDPTHHRFTPDVAGTWNITLIVSDGILTGDDAPRVTFPIRIDEDQPPCILGTTPAATVGARYILEHDDPPRLFRVDTVSDELDPYPIPEGDPVLEATRFAWWTIPPGGTLTPVPGLTLGEIWIDPASYDPGSIVALRVEAHDRIDRALPCDATAPVCPPEGACLQRVTWEVEIR